MLKLYYDGTDFAISTTCEDTEAFSEAMAIALEEKINSKEYDGKWKHVLMGWLRNFIEVSIKLKGYKNESNIITKTVVMTKSKPNMPVAIVVEDDRSIISNETPEATPG